MLPERPAGASLEDLREGSGHFHRKLKGGVRRGSGGKGVRWVAASYIIPQQGVPAPLAGSTPR